MIYIFYYRTVNAKWEFFSLEYLCLRCGRYRSDLVRVAVNSVFKRIRAAICGFGGMKYASAHEYYMNE